MALLLNKPSYPCKPIKSIAALARTLRLDEQVLISVAERADTSYRTVRPKPGSTRQTFDAKGVLKEIHRKIKERFFLKVQFPDYLHGSLKGCDYVTNASLHTNKQILICEDVRSFFPSVKADRVEDVWRNFFHFSEEVSRLLTALTTKDGALPQGAITSSYLANLVLWRDEPLLQAKLAALGITYSRYVDDMVLSSSVHLTKAEQSHLIAQVYGMLRKNGLSAKRQKHEVFSATEPMIATKLIVNKKPSLDPRKRSQIRAQVHQLELAQKAGEDTRIIRDLANKAAQRVGQLGRFHPREAEQLRARIRAVRDVLPVEAGTTITTSKGWDQMHIAPDGFDAEAPW